LWRHVFNVPIRSHLPLAGTLQTCRHSLFALSVILLSASTAQAGARHYMLIFGAQTHPKIPRFTHTFCTIVRVADPPPGCSVPYIEAHTISWLPQTLKIRPYRLHPEPGRNLTLEETLRWCAQNRMDVSLWGPYVIESGFIGESSRNMAVLKEASFSTGPSTRPAAVTSPQIASMPSPTLMMAIRV
jgi:hypothetical protein